MTRQELADYAETQISESGVNDALGTETLCVYVDDDEDGIRLSDGHGKAICHTTLDVDRELQAWVDWVAEDAEADEHEQRQIDAANDFVAPLE